MQQQARAALTARRDGIWIALWSLLLGLLALGPALGPGAVLTYDMVWVPDLALTRDVFGLSTALPRAVPSDAVVGALDEIVPGLLLQKIVLLAMMVAAGIGAARMVPGPLAGRLVAAGLYQWNAFVVERLLLGHWPVLVGYALLPWLLLLARRWRAERRLPPALLVLLPLASLSASAGLASAILLVTAAWGAGRRLVLLAMVAAANAPWVLAGLAHAADAATDPAGARAFALNDEGAVPGPVAALTLGGIWNSEVVPSTRAGVLGWVSLVALGLLVVLGARRWWREHPSRERTALLVCWGVGWVSAVLTWVAPDQVGALGEAVPGLGLLRDGSRLLGLCAPLLVMLVAAGVAQLVERVESASAARSSLLLAAALLPVALLPDAVAGVGGRLTPASYPETWSALRTDLAAADPAGDVLILPLTPFRRPSWNHDRTVYDPLGRYLGRPFLASDVLVVSGVVIAGEDPRVGEAATALEASTPEARAAALAELGVGAVVVDTTAPGADLVPDVAGESLPTGDGLRATVLDVAPAVREAGTPAAVMVVLGWSCFAGSLLAGLLVAVRARRRTRSREVCS